MKQSAPSNQHSAKARDFRDLQTWKKAHELVLNIYKATATFPKEEIYGLTQQLRRAAVSTAANIVEGSRRRTDNDFAHFLSMSQASNDEVKYYFILARDLGYLHEERFIALSHSADEISAMLYSFSKAVERG